MDCNLNMKKVFLILILLLNSFFIFAEADYNNGNGSIISDKKIDNIITIRKFDLEVTVGDMLNNPARTIYDNYQNGKEIGTLKDNDKIKFSKICVITYLDEAKNKFNYTRGEIWYNFTLNGKNGWLCKIKDYYSEYDYPYFDYNYEILQKININEKIWTVRKLEQQLSVFENLNIRDNPGTKNTKVIYTSRPKDTDPIQTNVSVIAITEETEIIDNLQSHWLKIKYKDFEGWIFGVYASAERGGPKLYIPENIVMFNFEDYNKGKIISNFCHHSKNNKSNKSHSCFMSLLC